MATIPIRAIRQPQILNHRCTRCELINELRNPNRDTPVLALLLEEEGPGPLPVAGES